ncbi:HAD-IA family hydrolase [Candidatus Daviesbacteria bacterium]|nr:HAD-IA family hydrolase [Candidatus Daviesbacteria bacterium]
MNKFKAILFDVDGTLLDTDEWVFEAFNYSLKKHNLAPITKKQLNSLMGNILKDCYKILAPNGDLISLCEAHETYQNSRLNLIKAFPKSRKTLKTLKKSGIKLAAVSSRYANLIETLKVGKLYEFLEVVISADDVKNPKPHPEPLLLALKKLNVEVKDALMVGDTHIDILAGKAAKVKTAAVTYGFFGKEIAKQNPDFLLDNLEQLLEII